MQRTTLCSIHIYTVHDLYNNTVMAEAVPAEMSNTFYIEARLRSPTSAEHITRHQHELEQSIRDNLPCIFLGQIIYAEDGSKCL